MIALGIDCGTQSTKTIAFDLDSRTVVAHATRSYGLIEGLPPGHAEQDPAAWIEALEGTILEVLDTLGARRRDVSAIGVSGQQHGFVPLDANGAVIRPAKLWCDTSTTEECALFSANFGGSKGLIGRLGLDVLPGFTAPKILWLKRHEPQNFARLATVLLPHDYLNFHLTGETKMEYGDASGTALVDIRSRQWEPEICAFIDPTLTDMLPPLESSRSANGWLRHDLAKKWNLPHDVVVSAGGGDNMMGAIGTGNVLPGRVTASLGTSGTIFAYAEKPVVDPEGEIAAFCDSTDAWLPLLCTMNVTVATEAARNLFGWSHSSAETAISSVATGSDGLLFLPYLQGERTPNLPHARGSLHGITLKNYTPAHIARATMEGVTLGLAYGLERLRNLGISPTEIRLTGGGSKSSVWRTICADVFGVPIVTIANAEGAAFGAVIQAIAAVRPEKTVNEWAEDLVETLPDERVDPTPDNVAIYREFRERHTQLTRLLNKS